ncbi:prepilin peptidase [Cytobacillus purgationiresistens]|uniref:Leader peptidase (Prepilin peptidase)/N-methyltransferase n=1 Tax=Cytobacillus purgationiresistens TaxID=863449 RepID=A0ABU0AHS9_9BACI|nr:A24 family peptidase [Cytobacillus purgationiresistens]MDQ0269988.1 leader peptidase (prepilin peptidase)/N-methyltransferase [Cytobacillus purgationiresistens]
MIIIYIFIIGLILGSFYNVVGLRIPLKQSIVAPRSACPSCGHQLRPFELIPVLSYLFQGGKCRQCKIGISPLYPIVELMTGVLFILAPLLLGWTSELIVAWTLISLFMIIFVSDVSYMLIPNKILLVFTVIFVAERLIIPLTPWWNSLLGAAIGFVLLLSIAVISNGGMGGGDIKLFALLGFVVGTKTVLLSFFLATFYGAAFGVMAMLVGKVKRGSPIPFGPFIVAGTLTAYYFGDVILRYYLQLL